MLEAISDDHIMQNDTNKYKNHAMIELSKDGHAKKYTNKTSRDDKLQVDIPTSFMTSMTTMFT